MCALFLCEYSINHDKMTFFDLLHKIEWVDVKPHIERHLTECHGMKLSDYERLYDRLRKSAPARWIRPGHFGSISISIAYFTMIGKIFRTIRSMVSATMWLITLSVCHGKLRWLLESNNWDICTCPTPNGRRTVYGKYREKKSSGKFLGRCVISSKAGINLIS